MEMTTGAPLSLRYHSDQLNNKVIALLREFYQTGEFCDIILHVGSSRINAHRIVLAAFSPYFRDLFHQPSSRYCNEITLQSHLKEESVRQLVDFCYSSDITVDSQSADKILTAANFLQIKEVEKLCITFLAAQQALKVEAGQPPIPPVLVPPAVPSLSPSREHQKADNSRELACADTSGIGSSNTSPRQSSRPSSVPSGNGSVQPLEDPDLDVMVKKENDESPSDQPFFSPSSLALWGRRDYESLHSSMRSYPSFYFPPAGLTLPSTPAHHQLLMKALTATATSHSEMCEPSPQYGRSSTTPRDQDPVTSRLKEDTSSGSTEGGSSVSDVAQSHQCHICLKQFQSMSSLKFHITEHREILTVPSASPYKMMSPVQKLSNQNSNQATSPSKKEPCEDYSGGSNMCGTCGKSFRDPQSLKFHRYNHVLRYQCNYCGKRFSRSWNLHRHRKTHYRQLQDGVLGSDDGPVIDVDSGKEEMTSYTMEKDKILTSPYADYRNHRHDMMPFAFDLGKFTRTSTYGMDGSKEEKEEHGEEDLKDHGDDDDGTESCYALKDERERYEESEHDPRDLHMEKEKENGSLTE